MISLPNPYRGFDFEESVTFGRFNIPHSGHIELIQKMLHYSKVANVFVSTGKTNNCWDLRVLFLRVLCREYDVDLNRVKFLKAKSPYSAVHKVLNGAKSPPALILGSDQQAMGELLAQEFSLPLKFNTRTNSSTNIRFVLDNHWDTDGILLPLYSGNKYLLRLAKILRKEEIHREAPEEVKREVIPVAIERPMELPNF